MPLAEARPKNDSWDNGISRSMRADEEIGKTLETWNTCSFCGAKWKDPIRTEGVLHRTTTCGSCVVKKRKNRK